MLLYIVLLFSGTQELFETPNTTVISCREHDKGPDELSVVLRQLMDGDFNFTISLLGSHTTDIPGMNLVDNNNCLSINVDIESFKELIPKLGARLLHSDHVPTDSYWEIISKADVVVSTAQHEFFGVAMYAICVLCRMLGRIVFNVFQDGGFSCRLLSFVS